MTTSKSGIGGMEERFDKRFSFAVYGVVIEPHKDIKDFIRSEIALAFAATTPPVPDGAYVVREDEPIYSIQLKQNQKKYLEGKI